ncbi:MAG TPA: nitroreductase family protein [Planctomycetota bacterium]|nr:nitroreductase family protein [Planctomycetota bacterium]
MTDPILAQMAAHRTVRAFLPDPVPTGDIRRVVSAAQMAATSSWIQAYSLLQVTRPAERAALSELAGNQAQVRDAGAFFVVLADTRRHRRIQTERGKPYAHNLEVFLTASIDASLFAQNVQLGFEALGYGTCCIGALRNDVQAVCKVLELPDGVYPLFGLCVGRPAADPGLRPRLATETVWFEDRYPSDDTLREQVREADALAAPYYAERGQSGRDWSGAMARRFDHLERTPLRGDYEAQGASFE